MLRDDEIDQLENYIVHSTIQDLPALLMRAIPLLFSELRLARAALDQQTAAFLQGGHRDSQGEAVNGREGSGVAGGVPTGGFDLATSHEAPPGDEGSDHHADPPRGSGEAVHSEVRPQPAGNRRKSRRNKGKLDARGGGEEVRGEGVKVLPLQPRRGG